MSETTKPQTIEEWGKIIDKCPHEYAESQDDGYMYCPDCNAEFKES